MSTSTSSFNPISNAEPLTFPSELSIDDKPKNDENMIYQIPDKSEPYNMHLLNLYLKKAYFINLKH